MIRDAHYLLHLQLEGRYNCKRKRQRREWVRYFSLPPTHSLFNLFSPWRREQGITLTARRGWMCLCLRSQSPRGVTEVSGIRLSAGRAGKDGEGERERKTCWQAVHRQLQTSGRPGECPKPVPTEGRKTQDGVKPSMHRCTVSLGGQMTSFSRSLTHKKNVDTTPMGLFWLRNYRHYNRVEQYYADKTAFRKVFFTKCVMKLRYDVEFWIWL